MTTLIQAIGAGDAAVVRRVLAEDPATVDVRDGLGVSPLLRCLYGGRLDLLDAVLDVGPALDVFDSAALGDVASLAALLVGGADVSSYAGDGFTALHLAAFFDAPYAAALLLRAGADPEAPVGDDSGLRPLHSAVAGRSTGAVTALLAHRADADPVQRGGFTPLMAAAMHGDSDLADLLLACGADPRRAADDGRTAADLAAKAGYAALAAQLRSEP